MRQILKMAVVCLVVAVGFAWATTAAAEGQWQKVENQANCSVWNANPQPNEIVTWTGACVKELAHGQGTEIWRFQESGEWRTATYKGEKRLGRYNGWGAYVYANGNRYFGEWKYGKKHGRGVYMFKSGNKYDGYFKEGKRHGRGIFKFPNGDQCDCQWKRGKAVSIGNGLKGGHQAKCYVSGGTIKFIR